MLNPDFKDMLSALSEAEADFLDFKGSAMFVNSITSASAITVALALLACICGCSEPTVDSRGDGMPERSDNKTVVDADSPSESKISPGLGEESSDGDDNNVKATTALVTIEDLTASIKEDRAAARNKYDGKSLQLTGRVVGFQFGYGAGFYEAVWLGHLEATKETERQTVNCKCDFANVWEKLALGSIVTLEGNLHILSAPRFADLHDSSMVSVEETTPKKLTSVEIAKEYLDDPKTAQSNYYGKALFVTGNVVQHEGDMGTFYGGSVDLLLRGREDMPFAIDHLSSFEEFFRGIETGDDVTIYGTFTTTRPSNEAEKGMGLYGAQPVAVFRNDTPLTYDPKSGWVEP